MASKENYKCGIQECRLRQRKNELQEDINTKASRNECGEKDRKEKGEGDKYLHLPKEGRKNKKKVNIKGILMEKPDKGKE